MGCGANDSTVEGAVKPSVPIETQEVAELGDEAYEEVYDFCAQLFDQIIEEFNEEALEPDIFFAEYGITSVYEEKLEQMEIEGLQAQDTLDDIYQNNLGNEEDWEIWTSKMDELYNQKLQELEEAHEVMLAY